MSKYLINESTLTGIADAIRTKKGTGEPIPTKNFPAEIESIGENEVLALKGLIEGSVTDLEIPNGITKIADYALYRQANIISVSVPDSVTSIGEYAFQNCSGLLNLVVPSSVNSIGARAFMGCSSLQSVNIPSGITDIPAYMLSGCSALTSVDIPNTVTTIGSSAFNGCSSLTRIEVPDSVESIETSAFKGTSSLNSITLPFIGRSNNVIDEEKNWFGYVFGASSYSSNKTAVPASLKHVTITKTRTVMTNAFAYCNNIESIAIPNIGAINANAFYGCSSCLLYDFRDASYVPHLSSLDIFYGINDNAKILVPENLYDEWVTATNWASYSSHIVTEV